MVWRRGATAEISSSPRFSHRSATCLKTEMRPQNWNSILVHHVIPPNNHSNKENDCGNNRDCLSADAGHKTPLKNNKLIVPSLNPRYPPPDCRLR
jgi:hypothetical protein